MKRDYSFISYLLIGLIGFGMGITMIAYPYNDTKETAIIVGVTILAIGLLELAAGLLGKRVFEILSGSFVTVLGIITLSGMNVFMYHLGLFTGLLLIFVGSFGIANLNYNYTDKGITRLLNIIYIVLGILAFIGPWAYPKLMVPFSGVFYILFGLSYLWRGMETQALAPK